MSLPRGTGGHGWRLGSVRENGAGRPQHSQRSKGYKGTKAREGSDIRRWGQARHTPDGERQGGKEKQERTFSGTGGIPSSAGRGGLQA